MHEGRYSSRLWLIDSVPWLAPVAQARAARPQRSVAQSVCDPAGGTPAERVSTGGR